MDEPVTALAAQVEVFKRILADPVAVAVHLESLLPAEHCLRPITHALVDALQVSGLASN